MNWRKDLIDKDIVIFGTKIVAKACYKLLKEEKFNIIGFYDNNATDNYNLYDLKVSRMDLNAVDKNTFFIITPLHVDEVISQLTKAGITNYLPAYELLDSKSKKKLLPAELQKIEAMYYHRKYQKSTNGIYLHSLDFVITERCTLKCKECSNLMQYYKAPCDIEEQEAINDINKICSLVDEIYELRLIGGEPFINKDWRTILSHVSKADNIKRVVFFTNGTIPLSDDDCSLLKKANTWLSISDYGELSRNKEQIISMLKKHNIPYELNVIPYWTKCSTIIKHKRNKNDLCLLFEQCCAKDLTTLLKGHLYPCPFIANATNLKAIPNISDDYVDIRGHNTKKIRERISQMIKKKYYASCTFCEGRPTPEYIREEDKIQPHEQINKPLDYQPYEVN